MIAGLLPPDRGEVRIDGGVVRGETDPVKRRLNLAAALVGFGAIAVWRFRWETDG